jgi:hypothetical protein
MLVGAWPTVGPYPAWISGIVAALILLGAVYLLLLGHRANARVEAELTRRMDDKGVLIVNTIFEDVSRRRIWPIRPRWCDCHGCPRPGPSSSEEPDRDVSWNVPEPPLDYSGLAPSLENLSYKEVREKARLYFGWIRGRRKFIERRTTVWACANQKVPQLLVEEVRYSATEPGEEQYTAIYDRRNALFGEYIEPGETLRFAHWFDVNRDAPVVGWRISFRVWGTKWNWFWRHPNDDCWCWQSKSFVGNHVVSNHEGCE